MSAELLPCPMCAGTAEMHEMEDYYMAACECGVNYEGPSVDDCAASWNRRAPVAAPIDAEGLPALPAPDVNELEPFGPPTAYSESRVRQAQRDAKSLGYALGRGAAVREYVEGREAGAAPEGCVLVPRVPTKEMLHAGMSFFHDKREPASKAWKVYKSMLAAARQVEERKAVKRVTKEAS